MIALLALALPGGPLELRRAQVDVTPEEPLPLGGYTERQGKLSEAGGDRLFVRVVVLQQGSERIAVASAELLTIPESLRREVQKLLPKDVHLFLASTHTHCAPDSQMLNERMTFSVPGIATYKRARLQWMSARIAKAVFRALRAAPVRPRSIDAFVGHLDRNHTRRPEDLPDQALVRVDAVDRQTTVLFWHYAAHPVFYGASELKTRGDWPGVLSSKSGGLVLLGAIGDVSPNMDDRPPADQIADFTAACLTTRFTRLTVFRSTGSPEPHRSDRAPCLAWVEQRIALGPKTPHPGFMKMYHVPEVLAKLAVSRFAPDSASITAFRIGKLAVVGVPGEPTAAIGRRIRDAGLRMGFSAVLVTSHVDGWIGYILEPEDYDRGGYEATLAMHGRNAGEKVVEAADDALRRLAAPPVARAKSIRTPPGAATRSARRR